jgi:hypothetical protein
VTHSDTITDLLSALCAARLAFPAITRNATGFSKRTGQRYGYADISAIIDGTAPVLAAQGLLLVQALDDGEAGTLRITSTLFHAASGQWLASALSVEKPTNMQDFGSVCTYTKRYAMQALLNLATEDDDDASSLNGTNTPAVPKAATAPAATNGHTPAPEPDLEHPTEAHLSALRALALKECHEEIEVYEQRIRQTMGLKPAASVAPKLLTRTMDMTQYMTIFEHYTRLKAQLARKTTISEDTTHGATTPNPITSQPTPPPAGESFPADPPLPGASSSAPEPDADATERDRQRLRAEVAAWDLRVPPEEVEHVIQHNVYSKARALLWNCRRNTPAATPIESAAD